MSQDVWLFLGRLLYPLRNLRRMHSVFAGNLPGRLVPLDGFQGHLRLQPGAVSLPPCCYASLLADTLFEIAILSYGHIQLLYTIIVELKLFANYGANRLYYSWGIWIKYHLLCAGVTSRTFLVLHKDILPCAQTM
jgi:hypothetical protein